MIHGYLEMTDYPKAGDAPPEVKLGIVDVETGQIVWADLNEDLVYTAWIYWSPAGDRVFFQQMNRDQNTLHLYSADLATGKSSLVYEETQPTWVEYFEDIHFLEDNAGFILRSNRDGWYNLYHYSLDGQDWRAQNWRMVRYFALPMPAQVQVGVVAQSPIGPGTTVDFLSFSVEPRRVSNMRAGI